MYGYVFGAAEAGVPHHKVLRTMMAYVGNVHARPGPHILHYGIDFNIGKEYNWNDCIAQSVLE